MPIYKKKTLIVLDMPKRHKNKEEDLPFCFYIKSLRIKRLNQCATKAVKIHLSEFVATTIASIFYNIF